jgi:hypothetical protein
MHTNAYFVHINLDISLLPTNDKIYQNGTK